MVVNPARQVIILPVNLSSHVFRGDNPSFPDERIKILPDTRQGSLRIAFVDLNKKRRIDNVKKNRLIGF
ncbi:MAG: hypothetical protein WAN78_00480 [Methanoregula sp.]